MKFKDTKSSKEHRFTIGYEEESNKKFISFPVTINRFVDFEAYYELTNEEYTHFNNNLLEALNILDKCKSGDEEARRLYPKKDKNEVPC